MDEVNASWQDLSDRLTRFARTRVPDADAAADIAQETIARGLAAFGSDVDMTAVTRWCYRTVRNLIIDRYRRRTPRTVDTLDDVAGPEEALAESDDLHRELGSCAKAMLDHLEPAYRQAVALADVEGLDQPAIAEQLGMSLSAVKSRVQRGRAKLRGMLLDCCLIGTDRRGNVTACERTERSSNYCAG